MTPDLINGLFEFFGGLFILMNVVRLHRDKMVRGVHWLPTSFFATWGIWNLYYYPSLHQWMSFTGGLFIVTFNLIWIGQMVYYIRQEKR